MGSTIGDLPGGAQFPEELPKGKKRGRSDDVKVQKLTSVIKKESGQESQSKKVRMQETVRHRQTYGAERRHGRYSNRVKEQKLPLVDESSNSSWKKLNPLLHPIGSAPVGDRESRELTEKSLTKRGDTQITRARSPAWREPDLKALYESACKSLTAARKDLTLQAIEIQMAIEARSHNVATDVLTLRELKGIYCDLFAKEEKETLEIPETTMLTDLMGNMRDIVSIEKNADNTFSISYSQVSEKDIKLFLRQMQASGKD